MRRSRGISALPSRCLTVSSWASIAVHSLAPVSGSSSAWRCHMPVILSIQRRSVEFDFCRSSSPTPPSPASSRARSRQSLSNSAIVSRQAAANRSASSAASSERAASSRLTGRVGEGVDVAGADRAVGEGIFERRQLVAHRGPIGGRFGVLAGPSPASPQDLGGGGVDTRGGAGRDSSGDGDVDRIDHPRTRALNSTMCSSSRRSHTTGSSANNDSTVVRIPFSNIRPIVHTFDLDVNPEPRHFSESRLGRSEGRWEARPTTRMGVSGSDRG